MEAEQRSLLISRSAHRRPSMTDPLLRNWQEGGEAVKRRRSSTLESLHTAPRDGRAKKHRHRKRGKRMDVNGGLQTEYELEATREPEDPESRSSQMSDAETEPAESPPVDADIVAAARRGEQRAVSVHELAERVTRGGPVVHVPEIRIAATPEIVPQAERVSIPTRLQRRRQLKDMEWTRSTLLVVEYQKVGTHGPHQRPHTRTHNISLRTPYMPLWCRVRRAFNTVPCHVLTSSWRGGGSRCQGERHGVMVMTHAATWTR